MHRSLVRAVVLSSALLTSLASAPTRLAATTSCAMETLLQKNNTVPAAPARPAHGHKGTYGTAIVIGGSYTMVGAPAISATAALRSGAGLCRVFADRELLHPILSIQPSATTAELPDKPYLVELKLDELDPDKKAVLAVGPGFQKPVEWADVMRDLAKGPRRAVFDADALNLLSAGQLLLNKHRANMSRDTLVLTPHPGEFRRLAEVADIKESPTDQDETVRATAAAKLSEAHNAVVVLKGQHTIVTDGKRYFVNQSGNTCLSTAGSGDVLTGIIAALMAQGLDGYSAACLGVHVHGRAAELWSADNGDALGGLLAMELTKYLPKILFGK